MNLHEFADKDCAVGLRNFTVIGYSDKVRILSLHPHHCKLLESSVQLVWNSVGTDVRLVWNRCSIRYSTVIGGAIVGVVGFRT